jgi:hypothetical protein
MHMNAVVRCSAAVVAVGLAVASTTVATTLAVAPVGDVAGAVAVPARTDQDEFTVSGDIDGLYPGAVTMMDAHVTNPWEVAIQVTSVVVDVSDAGPDCPASVLHFAASTGSVDVAPLSHAVVPVEVTMDASAGDACRGASWHLEFTARALGPEGDVRTASGPGGSTGPSSDGPGAFAYTGSEIAAMVALGVALLLIGLLLNWARRHRQRGRRARHLAQADALGSTGGAKPQSA